MPPSPPARGPRGVRVGRTGRARSRRTALSPPAYAPMAQAEQTQGLSLGHREIWGARTGPIRARSGPRGTHPAESCCATMVAMLSGGGDGRVGRGVCGNDPSDAADARFTTNCPVRLQSGLLIGRAAAPNRLFWGRKNRFQGGFQGHENRPHGDPAPLSKLDLTHSRKTGQPSRALSLDSGALAPPPAVIRPQL